MKKVKILICIIMAAVLICVITVPSVVFIRGNLNNIALSEDFKNGMEEQDGSLVQGANLRIMSSNLLVHYKSWGGSPAKSRAKMFSEVLKKYQPDVVGIQEMCDEWFSCIYTSMRDDYEIIDTYSTGAMVRMTSMIYNKNTLELVENGQVKFSEGDNPRLRRMVWAVFKRKSDGKQFAVLSTHFDLIREGKEAEELAVMNKQADELILFVNELYKKYNCPVFAVGDFNAMENGSINGDFDAPSIYKKLSESLVDVKYEAQDRSFGEGQDWNYPSYDHIFLKGDAEIKRFTILSQEYIMPMSDHCSIFADLKI